MDAATAKKLYDIALSYVNEGKTLDALGIFTQLMQAYPGSCNVLHHRALCLASLRRFDDARQMCHMLESVGRTKEAEELRLRITQYEVDQGVRHLLLGMNNRKIPVSSRWQSEVRHNVVIGLVFACALATGIFVGIHYQTNMLASTAGASSPHVATVVKKMDFCGTQTPVLESFTESLNMAAAGTMTSSLPLTTTKPTPVAVNLEEEGSFRFSSREQIDALAPQLVLNHEYGRNVLAVTADAAVVEELPDSAWGNCRDLSVALNDRERTLLHFDVPVHRITTLHSAELVVEINSLDLIGQRKPVRIDLHRITQSWEEASLTWRNQPEYENTPAVTTEVDLEAGKVHIDVTPLVNEWIKGAPNYGVLIKTSTPHRTNKSEHSS